MKKLLPLAVAALLFSGCANAPKTTPGNCIFATDKVAEVHVEYEGKQVGFCCNRCKDKFAKLDAAGKAAAVAKVAK